MLLYFVSKLRCFDFAAILLIGFIIALAAGGCTAPQKDPKKAPVDSRPLIRMGAVPSESVEKIQDQYKDFVAYLERETGFRFTLIVEQDYTGIIEKNAQQRTGYSPIGSIFIHNGP